MIRVTARWLAGIGALALSACASAPLHYYTLIAPAAMRKKAPTRERRAAEAHATPAGMWVNLSA